MTFSFNAGGDKYHLIGPSPPPNSTMICFCFQNTVHAPCCKHPPPTHPRTHSPGALVPTAHKEEGGGGSSRADFLSVAAGLRAHKRAGSAQYFWQDETKRVSPIVGTVMAGC
jgi:hypothetical protein